MKIAILGSTNGTDMQYIIDKINLGELKDIDIEIVISNKKNSGILKCAGKYGINNKYIPTIKGENRKSYDSKIDKLLSECGVELILLIGYMKLMSKWFVNKWLNRVMNIHPSLLPAFSGGMDLNVHQAVIDRGCKYTGASLIFIDHGADTGPIISQSVVRVDHNDTAADLKEKVQKEEGKLLIEALELFRDNRIKVYNNKVFIT